MKDGPFNALQTDDLPLPELSSVLQQLVISNHARQRFTERARAGRLNKRLLHSGQLSRHSPPWRVAEDYRHSPDLYLLFTFYWLDGRPDQGCLLLQQSEEQYVATTFISESSNSVAERGRPRLPKLPSSSAKKIAAAGHCSEQQARARLEQLPLSEHRPSWLAAQPSGDAWIDGGSWAIALYRQLVGAGNPYHYRWGPVYNRAAERKRRSRERWNKKRF